MFCTSENKYYQQLSSITNKQNNISKLIHLHPALRTDGTSPDIDGPRSCVAQIGFLASLSKTTLHEKQTTTRHRNAHGQTRYPGIILLILSE